MEITLVEVNYLPFTQQMDVIYSCLVTVDIINLFKNSFNS